jgi:DNA-binding MarR family transcriptional regulator
MKPQAMLNYLLGVTEGLVMYSIYSDYANKLQEVGTGKGFDINEDGYVPKAYKTIVDFTGVRPDTVKSSIERLVKKGLLQKKPGNKENNNIPLYRPEFKSSVFIKIAEEKLKTSTANKLNQQSDKEVLPQIIETLEKDQYVMIALGLVKEKIEKIRRWFEHMETMETKETEEALQEEAKVIPMKKQA